MLYKAYSTISPHSPQKNIHTPYTFLIRPDPPQKLRGGNAQPKQPYWRKPMGYGEIETSHPELLTRLNQISGQDHDPLTLPGHHPFDSQTRLVTGRIRFSMYDQTLLMHPPP